MIKFATKCPVCDEPIELGEMEEVYAGLFGTPAGIHICDECKEAIKYIKELKKILGPVKSKNR